MSEANYNAIEAQAAAWLARRESGDFSAVEASALQSWLDGSTYHRVAFLRLELAWEDAARLKALGAGICGSQPPSPGEWNLTPFFESHALAVPPRSARRRWMPAIAAALLLAVGLGGVFVFEPFGDRYSTPIGGIASVPLVDGSRVTLNTDSKIKVDLSEAERRIELTRGEAFFEVAKDATRPFVVRSGGKRVIAVGTKFSVRRGRNDIAIVVTEGQVRIEDDALPKAAGQGTLVPKSSDVLLTPGSIAHAGSSGVLVQRASIADAQMQLSWRTGVLMFRDQRLDEAIAEFNRYNVRQIVIADARVAELKVEGNFRPTNAEAFVRLLEGGFAVRAEVEEGRIVLHAR